MAALDVLALAAHPDDAEIGCGGTLIRSGNAGLSVGVVDLTAGERSTRGTPEIRAAERRRATDVLGVTTRIGLNLPDGGLDNSAAQRDAVVGVLRELRPSVVLAPYPRDRHPDHAAAGVLARDACFLAGVHRYAPGSAAHRPHALFHYLLHEPFAPSFVVDVTSVWARRTRAVAAYASQFGEDTGDESTALSGPRFLEVLDARAIWFGAMIGAERGEPFWSAGPLGLDQLPRLGRQDTYRMFI
jgi:bacillithiol biosynthesis deacetylase BshB1